MVTNSVAIPASAANGDAPGQVLLVDDDPLNLDAIGQALASAGLETITAVNGDKALGKLSREFPGVVVTDVRMPRMDGLELLAHTRALDPDLPVILVTGYGDVSMAVDAMQVGAYDFIEKPIDAPRLVRKVNRALRDRARVLEIRMLRARLLAASGIEATILGDSPAIVDLRARIANVAGTDATVLIRGKTGTGKELVARSVHDLSRRRHGNFVSINCGAIPENLVEDEFFGHEKGAFSGADRRRIGKIEHAEGGTLFLDEIESMPLALQTKLLRVLQECEVVRVGANDPLKVDFRLVAATQVDLAVACGQGVFREDLFYRLNVAELEVPPLAERREDIRALFDTFLQEFAARHEREMPEVSRDELHELMAHSWPGNVRELRNVAERRVLDLDRGAGSLSGLIAGTPVEPASLSAQIEAFERAVIEQELARQGGIVQATAEALGMPVRTLNDRMRRHGLTRKGSA